MVLSRDFAAKELEEFAAFCKRPLHLGKRRAPQIRSLERRFLSSSVLSHGDTVRGSPWEQVSVGVWLRQFRD